jgi:hypothetical protein
MAPYGVAAGRKGGGGVASGGRRRSLEWAGLGQSGPRARPATKNIPGKMKRAAKIVWAENELGSTAEF